MLSSLKSRDYEKNSKVAGYTIVFVPAAVICLIAVFALADWCGRSASDCGEDAPVADWPMWRYDAGRRGASPISLPVDLHLQWVRQLPKPTPAWRQEQYKLQFDRSYEPVVMGRQIFVPSMVSDKVVAYDTETGRQNWQFFCDGPVRFAPIAWEGRVYFASDDGCLYCLDAQDGELLWKSRLAPSGRRLLGNGRLISAWPARGGPVLHDRTIYCSASIWPFMGVFIYALDAVTGRVIWENSGTGAMYITQQHNSPAFAGVAPQGYLAADGNKLLVTSRTTPACFDCTTGELLYYPLSDRSYGKHVGGYGASIWKQWYFNNGMVYRLSDGLALGAISAHVMADEGVVSTDKAGEIVAFTLAEVRTRNPKDKAPKIQAVAQALWKTPTEPVLDQIHIRAGNRLYGSNSEGLIAAIEIPEGGGEAGGARDEGTLAQGVRPEGRGTRAGLPPPPAPEAPSPNQARIVWRDKVRGRVWNMLAGDGKLFVVTEEGELYCFGAKEGFSARYTSSPRSLRPAARRNRGRVEQILGQGADPKGYCLWLGIGDGRLLMETVRQSQMHVFAVEPDAEKVALLRERLDRAGLYGSRVSILRGDIDVADLPPYIASLVVVEDLAAAGLDGTPHPAEKLHDLLRPYTGVAWIRSTGILPVGGMGLEPMNHRQDGDPKRDLSRLGTHADATKNNGQDARATELPGVSVATTEDAVVIKRTGPVPGSADWTHQYGDVANTVCSKDQLKPPLGIAWFGEESEFGDVLPRHGHGPPEQVVEGRLFIRGIDSLSARDVYTGRTLWKKPLKATTAFGVYYDASYKHDFRYLGSNQGHIPGANARGTDFVVTKDRIYVVQEDECHVLDPATGETQQVLVLPEQDGQERRRWAYIGVCDDYLIAGASFVRYSPLLKPPVSKSDTAAAPFVDWSVSKTLIVMNRYDGQVLWTVDANEGFIHNGIIAGGGKVFCLDAVLPYVKRSAKNHSDVGQAGRLLALDIRTGRLIWENRDCVFGTWLSFSDEFGVLLQAHRKSSDMLWEPGDRMAAFRAQTGEVLWDKKMDYTGPCMLRAGTIFTQQSAYDLLTGRRRTHPHPLTGEPIPWEYSRNYGCGTAIASENLLTFRSAAAGYYDLANDGGTGNFGGFRSGCTSNLIVADGVLNAPDYTSTCTCSYQNQTSLAMVHMPDVEMWTFSKIEPSPRLEGPLCVRAPIQRVGINFGAPGDRRAENGTLWLEYPSVGGSSPELDIALRPEKPTCFRRHSLRLQGGNITWVEASGAKGLRWVRVRVSCPQEDMAERFEGMGLARKAVNMERAYTVHLHFIEPEDKKPGQRRFDVALNGQTVLKGFDIVAEAGSPNVGIVKTFPGIRTSDFVTVSLTQADPESETILCGIEIVAEQ